MRLTGKTNALDLSYEYSTEDLIQPIAFFSIIIIIIFPFLVLLRERNYEVLSKLKESKYVKKKILNNKI